MYGRFKNVEHLTFIFWFNFEKRFIAGGLSLEFGESGDESFSMSVEALRRIFSWKSGEKIGLQTFVTPSLIAGQLKGVLRGISANIAVRHGVRPALSVDSIPVDGVPFRTDSSGNCDLLEIYTSGEVEMKKVRAASWIKSLGH